MRYDAIIVGGGPAGLSAALQLGRARKRVLLCDVTPARNARAEHVHGLMTRDGTPPAELRAIGRAQLAQYDVEIRDGVRVTRIDGELDAFRATLADGSTVDARRVVLCNGMIDEIPELPGMRELWGRSVFQCPYCHGWEIQDRAFAALLAGPEWAIFGAFLRGWSKDVIAFTDARFEVPSDMRERLERANVRIEERRIRALVGEGDRLVAIELEDGTRVARDALFMKPPQRQTELVTQLDLALDDHGYVRVDPEGRTSVPGIFAAGDLTTMQQSAILGAAAGARAAYALNHELTLSTY
ncbi:NAD(P)/FAD-dependent oxidoreductase [Sandaracinus amylolyticus]|nr:NAD(P)/FAD-dependent oxidoreductase [Sandaracinus amylolyticus]